MFRVGWREEEEEGQKESRGRNEGGREGKMCYCRDQHVCKRCGLSVKGCRKTMPCVQTYAHTMNTI